MGREELSPRDLSYRTEEDPGALLPALCPGWPEAPGLWEEGEELEEGWRAPSFPPGPTLHPTTGLPPAPPACPLPSQASLLPCRPATTGVTTDATRVRRPQVSLSLTLPDSGQAGHLWIHPLLEWGHDLCVCPKATRAASREGSSGLRGHPYGEQCRASDWP